MPKKQEDSWNKIGAWSFIAGLVIAILAGLFYPADAPSLGTVFILGVLGILVGILNVSDKEISLFLLATIAFLMASTSLFTVLNVIPNVGMYVNSILGNIVLFVGPGAAVVALKGLYSASK